MENLGACIEFGGYRTSQGYGSIGRKVNGKHKKFGAHRLAYAEVHGPIPEGMCVCHKCDNRICVNVDHLFLGTNADNTRDRDAKGRGVNPKGSAHGMSKLTEQDIPRIRDMIACGCSNVDIGKWFGVSCSTISHIKTGKKWTHVA